MRRSQNFARTQKGRKRGKIFPDWVLASKTPMERPFRG